MVTEQELLDFMTETAYKPLTYQELEKHFQLENAAEFREFLRMLNALEEKGAIYRTRTERYGIPERMNLLKGRMQVHAKGFGFLLPEDKDHPDVYIHANDMGGAMNGDTVLVRVSTKGPAGGRMEGEVVKIVIRAVTQLVGTFENHEAYGFLIPDDKRMTRDIFIPREKFMGAVTGTKVVVKLTSYPEGRAAAQGEVVEILGHKDDPGVDIMSIIRKHMLPESFSDEVMAEAEQVPEVIREEELVGRRDLRGKRIVTIDGEDAKDLDDAVNVERLPNGNYRLGVHIADVSYYVTENSALDREAYMRGCSVYLVDRVIPMLPHRLSNGICSLNPKVDRLTMSCEMELDGEGNVVGHDIFTSVIKTAERMTYTNVRKILQYKKLESGSADSRMALKTEGSQGVAAEQELTVLDVEFAGSLTEDAASVDHLEAGALQGAKAGTKGTMAGLGEDAATDPALLEEGRELVARYGDLVEDFLLMEELALKLRHKRMRRGAIDFDFQESKVLVDEQGKPTDIIKRERSIAEQIIEEFMLAANETVAEHFFWMKVPFLYRIHEDPDAEKLLHFMEFIGNFGYTVRGRSNSVHPRALQSLLEDIKGTKEETVISTVLLRSMKQARYEAESMGHFGLATEYYSHFTSPIRRYPDLIIHRVMREVLEKGTLSEERVEYLAGRMSDIARQSSERERVAVDAERETDALKKAEFMLDKVGEEFEGLISSVTNFGIFVELANTVEGLIRLSDLADDYYHYHEKIHALVGERTSRIFRIGDEVKVRVARVNMAERTIDFEMVDMKPRPQRPGGGFSGRGGAGRKGRGGEAAAGGGRGAGGKHGKGRRRGSDAVPAAGLAAGGKRDKKKKPVEGIDHNTAVGAGGIYLDSSVAVSQDGVLHKRGKKGPDAGAVEQAWAGGDESFGRGAVGASVGEAPGTEAEPKKRSKRKRKSKGKARTGEGVGAVAAEAVEGGDAGVSRAGARHHEWENEISAAAVAPSVERAGAAEGVGAGEAPRKSRSRKRKKSKSQALVAPEAVAPAPAPSVAAGLQGDKPGRGRSKQRKNSSAEASAGVVNQAVPAAATGTDAAAKDKSAAQAKGGSGKERRGGRGGRGDRRGGMREPAPRAWEVIKSSESSWSHEEDRVISGTGSKNPAPKRRSGGFDGQGGTPFYVGTITKRKK